MPSFGRQILGTTGRQVQVTADGSPEWVTGGVTIDWATVEAASGDTILADDVVILDGQKGLRYGTVLAKITASGKWGPADTSAHDGREALSRGNCGILNSTVLQHGPLPGFVSGPTDHPGVITGGKVFRERILAGTGDLPDFDDLEAALPRLSYALGA